MSGGNCGQRLFSTRPNRVRATSQPQLGIPAFGGCPERECPPLREPCGSAPQATTLHLLPNAIPKEAWERILSKRDISKRRTGC